MSHDSDGARAQGAFRSTTRSAHAETAVSCRSGHGDFRRICPNCGGELWDKECKSRCPRCHFFSDCSDPW